MGDHKGRSYYAREVSEKALVGDGFLTSVFENEGKNGHIKRRV